MMNQKELQKWNKRKAVHLPKWVWFEVCKKFPNKYSRHLPVYQDKKVILT